MIGRVIIHAVWLLAAALLASCIDSREEFWVDAWGGGRAEITCTLPAAAARLHGGEQGICRMIDDFLAETPAISVAQREVVTVGERVVVKLELEFDSALELAEIADGAAIQRLPSAAAHLLGEVKVEQRGRTMHFTRSSQPGRLLPGAALLPASSLDGRMVTIIHLPAASSASNADRVENNGRTLVWDTPLTEAVRQPRVTRFSLDIPIPWSLVLGVAVPLTLAGGWLIMRLRRGR
jgi:hypothetical protein